MTPGWRRVCVCGGVEVAAFCEECMAFRSESIPLKGEGWQVNVMAALDKVEDDPEHKAKRAEAWRGGTLGH